MSVLGFRSASSCFRIGYEVTAFASKWLLASVLGLALGLIGSSVAEAQESSASGSGRVILKRAGSEDKTKEPTNTVGEDKKPSGVSESRDADTRASDTRAGDDSASQKDTKRPVEKQIAVFGGGCFWCIEAVFERVWGVESVISGYSGGNVPNPTYQQVLTDQTGHAEVCRIEFDPNIVSYEELLMIFLKSHDPTSWNSQGPDSGTRYRSVIFFTDDAQKEAIADVLDEIKQSKTIRGKIVTEITPLKIFYPAEEYHQDYFAKHPDLAYCTNNILPKIGKFEKLFKQNSKVQKAKAAKKKKP
jgi:peptide-methionine (S)-S-oxide reductase